MSEIKAFSETEIGRYVVEVTGYDTNGSDPLWSTLGDIAPESVNNSATFPSG